MRSWKGETPPQLILPAEQTENTVDAILPADPNVLPLGYYLLFAMVDDAQSVARILGVWYLFTGGSTPVGTVQAELPLSCEGNATPDELYCSGQYR